MKTSNVYVGILKGMLTGGALIVTGDIVFIGVRMFAGVGMQIPDVERIEVPLCLLVVTVSAGFLALVRQGESRT